MTNTSDPVDTDAHRVKRWLFRAYLGWQRGWIEAARAKQRRNEAQDRIEPWKADAK